MSCRLVVRFLVCRQLVVICAWLSFAVVPALEAASQKTLCVSCSQTAIVLISNFLLYMGLNVKSITYSQKNKWHELHEKDQQDSAKDEKETTPIFFLSGLRGLTRTRARSSGIGPHNHIIVRRQQALQVTSARERKENQQREFRCSIISDCIPVLRQ